MASTAAPASVQVVKLHSVHHAHDLAPSVSQSAFKLGPFDLISPISLPIDHVWVYPRNTSTSALSSPIIALDRLIKALSLLLDTYYHLSGRFYLNSQDKGYNIDNFGSGIFLYEAVCDASLDSFRSPNASRIMMSDLPEGGNALIPPFSITKESPGEHPFFLVQHTTFSCSSVSIGIRISHGVCDAQGMFQLAQDLAYLYRGISNTPDSWLEVSLPHPPILQSYLNDFPESDYARLKALDFKPTLCYIADHPPPFPEFPTASRREIRFGASELEAMKRNATDLNASNDGFITTFDSLCAHVFQRIHMARALHAENNGISADTIAAPFLTSKNWRSELNLGDRYFANAVTVFYFTLPHSKVAKSTHAELSKYIHDTIRSLSSEEVVQNLRFMAAQPDKSKLQQSFSIGNGTLTTTQWCRYDSYIGTDYGVDEFGHLISPVLGLPPRTPIATLDGVSFFVATEDQQQRPLNAKESIDFVVTLADPIWDILDADPLWRGFGNSQL